MGDKEDGNYCQVPGQGTCFYGRDLRGEVDAYQAFEAWCEVHGGKVDWVE